MKPRFSILALLGVTAYVAIAMGGFILNLEHAEFLPLGCGTGRPGGRGCKRRIELFDVRSWDARRLPHLRGRDHGL